MKIIRTDEDYAKKADTMWRLFTPNERHLVGIGVFPAAAMDTATKEGYESQPLAVALMRHLGKPEGPS